MPANYVLLEKITVGAAGASTVEFSNIPQTGYTDLVVKASCRGDSTATAFTSLRLLPNGSSSSGSTRWIRGNGSAASSDVDTTAIYSGESDTDGATANTFTNVEWYIPNYAGSTNKSFSIDSAHENNATTAYLHLVAGLWSSSSAITSITLDLASGSFKQYSTFYLYGVAKLGTTPAIVPYATGGDTIMTDGTYWYHTFTSSGTFTPAKALTCDYLVVAGGGGGGVAGGGAGGLRSTVTATGGGGSLETPLSLASGTGYTVTIGAGGGTTGSNSVFSSITALGGGSGGVTLTTGSNGVAGGSGGGANTSSSGVARTGGAGTANQGFSGGNSAATSGEFGGGGGGAGAVGANGTLSAGGNGGAGVATSISGSSVTYAGGGGGTSQGGTDGTGGAGGGGNAETGSTGGQNGTANRGGGGGGGYGVSIGNGGSGIVIVRYAV